MENNLPQTPNNTETYSQQATQQQPMTPQKSSLPMILGGLALLVLGFGSGYYFGTKQSQQAIVQTASVPNQVTTSNQMDAKTTESTSMPASETSEWPVLNKPEWGFSIKYPPTYAIIKNDAQTVEIGADSYPDVIITTQVEKYDDSNLCTGEETTEFCITGNGEPGGVETITVAGLTAKSFYLAGGVDNLNRIVTLESEPAIQFKANMTGGGLSGRFENMLSTVELE